MYDSRKVKITDAAKRMAGIVNAMLTFHQPWELRSKVMAFRLSDGGSDGAIYDTKQDAVRHQLDEYRCCYLYFRNCMGGLSALDAQIFLDFNRQAHDAGLHMPDPDSRTGGPDPIHSVVRFPDLELP